MRAVMPSFVKKGSSDGGQRGEAVERHRGEVVVLEVEVRPEVDELPERRARHPRAPLRGLRGHDVVMLPEAVESEGGGKDEKDRNGVEPQEARGPAEKADRRGRETCRAMAARRSPRIRRWSVSGYVAVSVRAARK